MPKPYLNLSDDNSFKTPYLLNGEIFEIISQEGNNVTVKCRHCASKNVYRGSVKSTGNFHMHIKRKHPHLIPRIQALKLASMMYKKRNYKTAQNPVHQISRKSSRYAAINSNSDNLNLIGHKNYDGGHNLENIIQTKIHQNMLSSQSVNTMSSRNNKNNKINARSKNVTSTIVSSSLNSQNQQKNIETKSSNNTNFSIQCNCHPPTSVSVFNQQNEINNFPISFSELQNNGIIKDTAALNLDNNIENYTSKDNNTNTDNNGNNISEMFRISMASASESISQMHNTFKSILFSLNVRNQIEYQRTVIEFAKFQYLQQKFGTDSNNININNLPEI